MIKVAYILGGLPFGGIESSLYHLCLEYGKSGLVRPRVFNLSGTGQLASEYARAGIDVVDVVDVADVVEGDIRAIASHRLDTTLKLRKLLKAFAPDVIHTMHFSANHHGRLAALGLGIPVITHIHNIKRERKLERRLSDKLLSCATTEYLAVSRAVADVVREDHNLVDRPVRVLYNVVTPGQMDFPPLDFKAEYGITGPVALAVSRYVPQKNLDLLVRAVGLLRQQGRDVSLILVGEGTERPRLEALIQELGLSGYVVLAGFRSDVPAFYQSARIFAMPSDFEGLPIAHLEAMYFGLPAVVSAHVPSLEIAAEASLVCELKVDDLACKLAALLEDSSLYERLAGKAKEVAAMHTMPGYAVALHGIYSALGTALGAV